MVLDKTDVEMIAEEKNEDHSFFFLDKIEVTDKDGERRVIGIGEEMDVKFYFREMKC